jgi:hypothetical protein
MSCFEAYNTSTHKWECLPLSKYNKVIRDKIYTSILVDKDEL